MAKVPFSKFGVKTNMEAQECTYINPKGEEIKYKIIKYLPFAEKLDLISNIINQSIDENGYYNPMRIKMYTTLEVVYSYTNLTFTDKMKEEPFKLYDNIMNSGIMDNIINILGDTELKEIKDNVQDTIKSIYDYKNSVLGILDTISSDYNDLDFDIKNLQQSLGDPNNLTLLKDIMKNLG